MGGGRILLTVYSAFVLFSNAGNATLDYDALQLETRRFITWCSRYGLEKVRISLFFSYLKMKMSMLLTLT